MCLKLISAMGQTPKVFDSFCQTSGNFQERENQSKPKSWCLTSLAPTVFFCTSSAYFNHGHFSL